MSQVGNLAPPVNFAAFCFTNSFEVCSRKTSLTALGHVLLTLSNVGQGVGFLRFDRRGPSSINALCGKDNASRCGKTIGENETLQNVLILFRFD